jgi:hypothetical protein
MTKLIKTFDVYFLRHLRMPSRENSRHPKTEFLSERFSLSGSGKNIGIEVIIKSC